MRKEVCLQREEDAGAARVPLAPGAATQLVVTPSAIPWRSVPIHVQAAGLRTVPLLLDHAIVFGPATRVNQLAPGSDFWASSLGALLGRLGDAVFSSSSTEGPDRPRPLPVPLPSSTRDCFVAVGGVAQG